MADKLGVTTEFLAEVGTFYGMWSTTELTIDFAVGKYLNIPYEDTHLITAGMDFNRKARLIMALLNRSSEPRKNDAIAALKVIQNESLRNTFAHSFLIGDENEVSFVERSRHGNYSPMKHTFTLESFNAHVRKLYDAGILFRDAIALTDTQFQAFADAAFNVKSKSITSPQPPSESA